MSFNFQNYANIISSFVEEAASETTDEEFCETSSEDQNNFVDKVIDLNLVQNKLVNIESRLMENDTSERLNNCQSLLEKEANILTSLNEKLLFLQEEVLQIKLTLFSFRHKKVIRIPKEFQKDFLEIVDILSDFNYNLEKGLENNRDADGNLNNFIEVFVKSLMEMKQAMCVLNKTYCEMKNENMRIKDFITTER